MSKKVFIACEYSGVVRDAFIKRGYDAISCDILPTESPGPHIQGDIKDIDLTQFDLIIAHPPCTHLCNSGARWFKDKKDLQEEALDFVKYFLNAPVKYVAVENPVGIISSRIEKPAQYIQPYHFGDKASKKTGLWLRNLPTLVPTNVVVPETITTSKGRVFDKHWYWTCSLPLSIRGKARSKTFQGIADAMAEQWGSLLDE